MLGEIDLGVTQARHLALLTPDWIGAATGLTGSGDSANSGRCERHQIANLNVDSGFSHRLLSVLWKQLKLSSNSSGYEESRPWVDTMRLVKSVIPFATSKTTSDSEAAL